jgi:hypothetical protein
MCISDDNITEAALLDLRKLKIPIINYHPDMGFLWFRVLRTGHLFDLVACAQQTQIGFLKKHGINAHFVPFGANPCNTNAPTQFEGLRYLGSPFPDRAAILGQLHKTGIPLEIWGHNWSWFPRRQNVTPTIAVKQSGFRFPLPNAKQQIDWRYYLWPRLLVEPDYLLGLAWHQIKSKLTHKSLDVEAFYGHLPSNLIRGQYAIADFEKLIQSARINLGFSHMFKFKKGTKPKYQMRLRDIEIPMAGGFYLAEHSDDLLTCFTPGLHIDTWQSKEELIEKSKYYLANPAKAAQIALQGQAHATEHHTWAHRYQQMFNLLGLSTSFFNQQLR